jgi:hemolysin-activating ACP:hemolysin acyltransferase
MHDLPDVCHTLNCALDEPLLIGLASQLLRTQWRGKCVTICVTDITRLIRDGRLALYFDNSLRLAGAIIKARREQPAFVVASMDCYTPLLLAVAKRGYRIGGELKSFEAIEQIDRKIKSLRVTSFEEARHLGAALQIFSQAPIPTRREFSQLFRHINKTIFVKQYKLLMNERRLPAAFVSWVWISGETEKSLQARHIDSIHLSEWNEGEKLYLLDAVSTQSGLQALKKFVDSELYAGTMINSFAPRFTLGYSTGERFDRLLQASHFE